MSDHERGAYTPPTDAPLTFDPRQPVAFQHRGEAPSHRLDLGKFGHAGSCSPPTEYRDGYDGGFAQGI